MDDDGAPIKLSVVVPVHNGSATLLTCLRALQYGSDRPDEIIVVDDASTDGSAGIAGSFACTLMQLSDSPTGASFARNRGAEVCSGEVILFVDADVAVHEDTVARIKAALNGATTVSAVFGSYDDQPPEAGLITRYKNLLHHYVHQHSRREAFTFWSGCGAIRRNAFYRVDGFDEAVRGIEDIELGRRLIRAGHRVELHSEILATHLKRWTLASMLYADIFFRAVPWTRLLLQGGPLPDDLNLDYRSRFSALAAWLVLACLVGCLFLGPLAALGALFCLGTIVVLNLDMLRFFGRSQGILFAVGATALHVLYFLYSSLTFVVVAVGVRLWERPRGG